MSDWEIYHVPDSPIILVLRDDIPRMTGYGTPVIFYRDIDAQRFIDEVKEPTVMSATTDNTNDPRLHSFDDRGRGVDPPVGGWLKRRKTTHDRRYHNEP